MTDIDDNICQDVTKIDGDHNYYYQRIYIKSNILTSRKIWLPESEKTQIIILQRLEALTFKSVFFLKRKT